MPPGIIPGGISFICSQLSIDDSDTSVEHSSGPWRVVRSWRWRWNRHWYRIISRFSIYYPSSRAVAVVIVPSAAIPVFPVFTFPLIVVFFTAVAPASSAVPASLGVGGSYGTSQEQHHQQYFFHVSRFLLRSVGK